MAKTLSQDLRVRLIEAVEDGMSRRAAAKRFEVGVATAIRWVQEFRMTGATAARPKGGDRRSHRIEACGTTIVGAIEAQVDITLVELAELLQREHGLSFAPSTVWRFLHRHDITFKKNRARQRAAEPSAGHSIELRSTEPLASSARCRRAATGVVRRPARDRPGTPGFHR
jgi:transposase